MWAISSWIQENTENAAQSCHWDECLLNVYSNFSFNGSENWCFSFIKSALKWLFHGKKSFIGWESQLLSIQKFEISTWKFRLCFELNRLFRWNARIFIDAHCFFSRNEKEWDSEVSAHWYDPLCFSAICGTRISCDLRVLFISMCLRMQRRANILDFLYIQYMNDVSTWHSFWMLLDFLHKCTSCGYETFQFYTSASHAMFKVPPPTVPIDIHIFNFFRPCFSLLFFHTHSSHLWLHSVVFLWRSSISSLFFLELFNFILKMLL